MLQPIHYIFCFANYPCTFSKYLKNVIRSKNVGLCHSFSGSLDLLRVSGSSTFSSYVVQYLHMSWGHFEKGSLQDLFTTICFWKIFRGWLRPTFPNLRATFLVSRVSTMFRLMFIGNVRTNVRHQTLAEDHPQCLCPNLIRNKNFFGSNIPRAYLFCTICQNFQSNICRCQQCKSCW